MIVLDMLISVYYGEYLIVPDYGLIVLLNVCIVKWNTVLCHLWKLFQMALMK